MISAGNMKSSLTGHAEEEKEKFLTFALNDEIYGLEVMQVKEIISTREITRVPHTPSHIQGVINQHGRVVPVMNLRARFGIEDVKYGDDACIVITQLGDAMIGILVDSVEDVYDIAMDEIQNSPEFGEHIDVSFIIGIATVNKNVKILLDMEKVLKWD